MNREVIDLHLLFRLGSITFEVALPVGLKTQGVILSDQIKSLNWKARSVSYIETGSAALISEVQAKVESLIL
jgi:mRNA interferase MazF